MDTQGREREGGWDWRGRGAGGVEGEVDWDRRVGVRVCAGRALGAWEWCNWVNTCWLCSNQPRCATSTSSEPQEVVDLPVGHTEVGLAPPVVRAACPGMWYGAASATALSCEVRLLKM